MPRQITFKRNGDVVRDGALIGRWQHTGPNGSMRQYYVFTGINGGTQMARKLMSLREKVA